MKPLKIESLNEKDTDFLAEILAKEIKKSIIKRNKAFTMALKGVLGAGKTTLVRYLSKKLGIHEKVLSPSFLIFKKYNFKIGPSPFKLMHVDCYRIKNPGELKILGFKNDMENPKNLILVEWAEKIKKMLPKDTLWLEIKITGPKSRIFKFR